MEIDSDTARFEAHRSHLRAVAYRMLGSLAEADDAVQETWLRYQRADTREVANLGGWLTTVAARVCLDLLRTRTSRREDALAHEPAAPSPGPDDEAALADAVGLALLVVLDTLSPAERVAFVLHDLFSMSFEEVAATMGKTVDAARQLASRARRRVRGAPPPEPDVERQRVVVDAFLAAMRGGDVDALLDVLDPDVVVRLDRGVVPGGGEIRGAATWAPEGIRTSRGAVAARPALIDGAIGVVIAPRGHLRLVLRFTIEGDRIHAIDAIGDPARLASLAISLP
jgi:RNA polymerase sigma-70 factor, ECF subfamily